MTAPKFTPGPWVVADSYGPAPSYGSLVNAVSDSIEIASCCVHCSRDANANAHLIAAAPELYAALETLVAACACGGIADFPEVSAEHTAAVLALARARGEDRAELMVARKAGEGA